MEQGLAGRLRIGCVGVALFSGLPQLLNDFQQSHPSLRLALRELNSQDQLLELARGRLGLGFVHSRRVPRQMSSRLFASEPFVCCLPAGHASARKASVRLDALRNEPFVLFARACSPDYHERILAICSAAGFDSEIRHEARHWLSVVALVAQGLGVALAAGRAGALGVERSRVRCARRPHAAVAMLMRLEHAA